MQATDLKSEELDQGMHETSSQGMAWFRPVQFLSTVVVAAADMSKSRDMRVWGIVLLLFGALVLKLLNDGMPERSSLTEITGQLRSLEKSTSKGGGLSSVRFSLTTDSRYFSYHSSAGDIDDVWEALSQAGYADMRVLIDPADSHSPPFDERSFCAALEVTVGKKAVRHYSEVVESLSTNDFIGAVLGYGTAAIGAILMVAAFLRRRQDT